MPSSRRTLKHTSPRLDASVITSPSLKPSANISAPHIEAVASGSMASSTVARRVMLPVCQCSSCLPVIRTKGKLASGLSLAGMMSAGTKLTRPSAVAKCSLNTVGSPGSSSERQGYVTLDSRTNRSQEMPLITSCMACLISSYTSATPWCSPLYCQFKPMPLAIC